MAGSERTRLHISPFNAGLYDIVVPKALQPAATRVSFHTVQTFPERGFGYVELPTADADKLRKKLNGFILKGAKMSLQEAKPEKRRRDRDDAPGEAPRKKAKKEKSKKKDKEITGFELPDDRHVKRGWTDEAGKPKKANDKKDVKREKSKYISGREVLFKQKLPKPAALAEKADAGEKKDKRSKKPKHHVVLHEFEKTKKHPSFLRSEAPTSTGTAAEFVEGKGWVDSEGTVIEAVHVNPKREDRVAQIPEVPMEVRISKPAPAQPSAQSAITAGAKALGTLDGVYNSDSDSEPGSAESSIVSGSGSSSSSSGEDEDKDEAESEGEHGQEQEKEKQVREASEPAPAAEAESAPEPGESEDSRSKDSDADVDDDDDDDNVDEQDGAPEAAAPDAMDVDGSPARPATPPREMHPLEALFKRPRPDSAANETPRPAPIKTAFSFFDAADDDENEAADNFPQTPFNMDESRGRGMRSAAPTPDTAAIGRKFSFSFANHHDIDEEDEDAYDQEYEDDANQVPLAAKSTGQGDGDDNDETEFAKWFWENRGDTNRAWKKRRRDVLKQKRQRENRRLSRRVI